MYREQAGMIDGAILCVCELQTDCLKKCADPVS